MVRMAKLLLYLILFKFCLVSTKKDTHKPEQQLHRGTLRELHNMTETFSNEECPPLNAISLPVYHRNLYIPPQFGSVASHEVAQLWVPTQYEMVFNVPDIKPQMDWSLIGSRGAIIPLHMDSDGLGTLIVVLNGSKYWILMMRFGEHEIVCSVDSLGPKWDPYFVNNGNNADQYCFEGVHLQKGDIL